MSVAIFIGALMAMIVLHELGHFVAAKLCGMRVERFSLFFGRPLARMRRGETEYAIGWLPAGGYVKITGMTAAEEVPAEHLARAYFRRPVWKRVVVIAAGPAANVAVAALLFFCFFLSGPPAPSTTLAEVLPGGPGAQAGLVAGDRLVSVAGATAGPDGSVAPLVSALEDNAGHTTELVIERDGATRQLPVRLGDAERPLAISFASERRPQGPIEAARSSAATIADQSRMLAEGIVALSHSQEAREQLTTVVGITAYYEDASALGLALYYMASVSLLLGLFNLLPLLPLDGGHIVVALAEKVRGRPVPARVQVGLSMLGLALLLVGLSFGLSNDVGRLTSGGFSLS